MRAVTYTEIRGSLSVVEVQNPVAPDGGVVIDVHASGLCRSDWHAWAGHDDVALPHVPGHEFAGAIAAVGQGVTKWNIGDRVTAPFVFGCGSCEWCVSGNAQVCPQQQQPGFTFWGSFAQQVVVHAADANVVRVPDAIDMRAAAALGCRFATSYRALVARARVSPGEWVIVFGAGGVGLSAVAIASALGARVVAVDRHAGALEAAEALGAEATFVASEDVALHVQALTKGAHVTVDAVGSEATASDSIMSLRRRGRHVQIGLLPSVLGHPRLPMDRVIAWELDVLGSHGMAAGDYESMLALIASGGVDPLTLVSATVSLEDVCSLLPAMDTSAPVGITVVDPRIRTGNAP